MPGSRKKRSYYRVWYCGNCRFGIMNCERERDCLNCGRHVDASAIIEYIEEQEDNRSFDATSNSSSEDDSDDSGDEGLVHNVEAAEPEHLDTDYEHDRQTLHSISSLDTASAPSLIFTSDSASTSQTEVYAAAAVEIVKAFFKDMTLKKIFEAAAKSQKFFQSSFEIGARAAIKSFALKLEEEATDRTEKFAAHFVLKRPKTIARKISMYTFLQDNCSEESRLKLELAGPDLSKQQLIGRYLLDQSKRQNSEGPPPSKARGGRAALDEDDELPDEEIEIRELKKIIDFVMGSIAINHLRIVLANCIQEKAGGSSTTNLAEKQLIESPTRFVGIAKQLGSYITHDLQTLSDNEVDFLTKDPLKIPDLFKASVESFSGEAWNWWPFESPRQTLPEQLIRMQWRCRCGKLRRLDILPAQAEACREILKNSSDQSAGLRKKTMNLTSGEVGKSRNGIFQTFQEVLRSIWTLFSPSSGAQEVDEHMDQNATRGTSGASILSTTVRKGRTHASSPSRWILLCSFRGYHIQPSQIEVTTAMDDDTFFVALRREVRRLRGFWRSYFHPKQFHSCSFSKFTRIFVNRLTKHDKEELPTCPGYEHESYPAKLDLLNPPICAHEWYDRFYNRQPTGGFCRVIHRVPKRDERFSFHMHDKDEDMWGLHVELRISAARVLVWSFLIMAGGLGFFVWWMSGHAGDLQNAAVPLTFIMMALSALFIPLNEHFNRPF